MALRDWVQDRWLDLKERIWVPSLSARSWRLVAGGLVLIMAVYYPAGMIITHTVDDNLDFAAPAADTPPGASQAVAVAAALIEREIQTHRWVANDPFFLPGAALDNMPNFQTGLIKALSRFSFELTDQLGRTRGSSQADTDLQNAAGLLQYPPNVWVWDPSVSLAPTASSEAQYLKAARALRDYNKRLASGAATFERRADNLHATLDRIALDLGSASAQIDQRIEGAGLFPYDLSSDDVFYETKGRLYAYYLIVKALRADFDGVVRERQLDGAFAQTLKSLHEAASLSPLVITNGRPDALFFPSHLGAQGFFLLRARIQLREITEILLK